MPTFVIGRVRAFVDVEGFMRLRFVIILHQVDNSTMNAPNEPNHTIADAPASFAEAVVWVGLVPASLSSLLEGSSPVAADYRTAAASLSSPPAAAVSVGAAVNEDLLLSNPARSLVRRVVTGKEVLQAFAHNHPRCVVCDGPARPYASV